MKCMRIQRSWVKKLTFVYNAGYRSPQAVQAMTFNTQKSGTMKKKEQLSDDDKALFRQLMTGTRKLKQDTMVHKPMRKKAEVSLKRQLSEQADNSHYFSDEFQPLLAEDGPVRYVRSDVSHYELKKLRRGDYTPEIFLDLHGLTQQQAKQELGALIAACRREHIFCASVMHGHGKHILKQQTPLWLAQHPDVMAFHQAPKMFGGDAALLVLIEVEEWQPPELP
ncbi:putative DNA endonuclease SmrA [Mixta intestinalis]|jgi:DNA-nicking Smr family endonuclease|uniref:Ribosome rescue factor SmrB n=2 Tax=Mixta intestinalis TaxID=1615494 RepID=A0A6P1PZN5_9GAMM|nr:putative DNA endonuclease SmrA [Mixta intestinalis]